MALFRSFKGHFVFLAHSQNEYRYLELDEEVIFGSV